MEKTAWGICVFNNSIMLDLERARVSAFAELQLGQSRHYFLYNAGGAFFFPTGKTRKGAIKCAFDADDFCHLFPSWPLTCSVNRRRVHLSALPVFSRPQSQTVPSLLCWHSWHIEVCYWLFDVNDASTMLLWSVLHIDTLLWLHTMKHWATVFICRYLAFISKLQMLLLSCSNDFSFCTSFWSVLLKLDNREM